MSFVLFILKYPNNSDKEVYINWSSNTCPYTLKGYITFGRYKIIISSANPVTGRGGL
jgi:hypothetical protein